MSKYTNKQRPSFAVFAAYRRKKQTSTVPASVACLAPISKKAKKISSAIVVDAEAARLLTKTSKCLSEHIEGTVNKNIGIAFHGVWSF